MAHDSSFQGPAVPVGTTPDGKCFCQPSHTVLASVLHSPPPARKIPCGAAGVSGLTLDPLNPDAGASRKPGACCTASKLTIAD